MYEALNIQTNTYVVPDENGFFVDIQRNDAKRTYEAYIWNEEYTIKKLMFGVSMDTRYREFFERVEDNLDKYIGYYKLEVMEEAKTI